MHPWHTLRGVAPRHLPHLPEQHRANLQRRAPLVLQDVQADATEFVHVGVVNFSQKTHLGMEAGNGGGRDRLHASVTDKLVEGGGSIVEAQHCAFWGLEQPVVR
jgi:hypothetical protein